MTNLIMSYHAKKQWYNRFAGIDLEYEWCNAVKATKSQRISIKKACPASYSKLCSYFVSPCGCVFVLGKNVVITVIPLLQPQGSIYKRNNRTKKT